MRTTHACDAAELPPAPPPAVVSVGVFDGVHLGHQAILAANVARAAATESAPTVVTFGRHPKALLLGRAPRTLTTLAHRLELFQRAGIAHTVVLPFSEALRSQSAEDFTRTFLEDGLAASALVLGFDNKFGRDREGTPEALAALGHTVQVVPKVLVNGRAVSSTAIREAVSLGDLPAAASMLGRPPSVFGEVVAGRRLGRELGFPTANLDLHHELHPPAGVYATLVRRTEPARAPQGSSDSASLLPSVTNIGHRPTVEGERDRSSGRQSSQRMTIETHLLDFEEDLYGEHLEVLFLANLRPEEHFPNLAALTDQIGRDVAQARKLLAADSAPS
ncbi:MAG: riboflavin biosynthesis protein RibF [Planctomycetota bacterium]|nr:riboflavin biosynthesis protein RibF [Planctomycetota bacterium]MDP6838739.1 riboflavin biosynthesis protein RibF [Planctomycetota bacterium]MDP6955150.1 riboflavin biosynthesis protein RibF [Planctomycetota bacterium]